MKILIVGNGNHQLIRGLVTNLKKAWSSTDRLRIDVFSNIVIPEKNKEIYDKVVYSFPEKWNINIRGVNRALAPIKLKLCFRKLENDYDIINIHFIEENLIWIKENFSYKGKKLLLTFWGSDFYSANPKTRNNLGNLIKLADGVTFTNSKMANEVREYYKPASFKTYICKFGLIPLEKLKELNDKGRSIEILNLPDDKIIITIGYNLSQGQQHLDIFDELDKNIKLLDIKEKLFFIIPLTYGVDAKYKRGLLHRLHSFKYQYITLTNYLSDIDVAHLRNATDIFIQLQKTDQFSGSMTEHLYAGNIVITGSWLPYEEMKQRGVFFYEVDRITQLSSILHNVVININPEKLKFTKNKEAISHFGFWENNIQNWIKLYLNL